MNEAELLQMPPDAYMNAEQRTYFRQRLLTLRSETQASIEMTKQTIAADTSAADELDRAAAEEDNRQRLRLAERQYYLLRKIDSALDRLASGDYGFCMETGEPIGLERLLSRPTAELCVEAKSRREQLERNYRKVRGAS